MICPRAASTIALSKLSKSTTPSLISAEVRNFCSKVAKKSEPYYVDIAPADNALFDQCYYNVEDVIKKNGGSILFGWLIWMTPNVFIEAEHHAIWKDGVGTCVDVTPRRDSETSVLFLQDQKAKFYTTNPNWRDNQRQSLVDDSRVFNFLKATEKLSRFEIRHSTPKGRERMVRIPAHKVKIYRNLQLDKNNSVVEIQALLA